MVRQKTKILILYVSFTSGTTSSSFLSPLSIRTHHILNGRLYFPNMAVRAIPSEVWPHEKTFPSTPKCQQMLTTWLLSVKLKVRCVKRICSCDEGEESRDECRQCVLSVKLEIICLWKLYEIDIVKCLEQRWTLWNYQNCSTPILLFTFSN